MRILAVVAWLFVGLGAGIYHFGPGQQQLHLDCIASMIQDARQAVADQNWEQAISRFDAILSSLPADRRVESMQIQLEKAKAQMMAAELPVARTMLDTLLADVRQAPEAPPQLLADTQATLANAQYYMAWLMRLEGAAEEDWMAEIESSRQNFAQVMQEAAARGDSKLAQQASENVESAIRLARMDLGELQVLPLPCQCKGCCSGKGKKPGKRKTDNTAKGAGNLEIPEGSGS